MREPWVTRTINRAPFSSLILIFSESLQSWQQIQVRYCFRKIRFYKEPQLTHLLTPGIKPTPGSHSEWANLPIQSQGELCRYSAATQWRVGEKAPGQRTERTGLSVKGIFYGFQSQEETRQKCCPCLPQHYGGRCKQMRRDVLK